MATVVLTGASSGIGAAAAIELTRLGHAVLALGRSEAKLAKVHERMRAAAPAGVAVPAPLAGDLASMAEVRRLAAAILARCERIDVLVNNAGIEPTRRAVSPDGFELTLAVNHLAPFLLTHLLLDRLRESGGRVVTTSSTSHEHGAFDWSDLQFEREWDAKRSYGRSKLANILFTSELRKRTGIPASTFDPGSIRTDLNRDARFFRVLHQIERLYYASPEKGADTLVWLATSEEGGDPRAVYYIDRAPVEGSDAARDPQLAARLWDVSAELVGL